MLVSFLAWFVSNLAGSSSKLVITPLINSVLDSEAIIPAIATENLLSNARKILQLWQAIDWQVVRWYLPGSGIGALLSAYIFARTNDLEKLPLILGLYFVTVAFSPYLSWKNKHFTVRCWYFLFAGVSCAFASKFLGSNGSLLKAFYTNYGLDKKQTIATQAANLLSINVSKMCIYAAGGAVTRKYIVYGVAIAIAAIPANLIAQLALQKIGSRFKYLEHSSIAISSALILWQQQNYFYGLVDDLWERIYLLMLITSPVCHL